MLREKCQCVAAPRRRCLARRTASSCRAPSKPRPDARSWRNPSTACTSAALAACRCIACPIGAGVAIERLEGRRTHHHRVCAATCRLLRLSRRAIPHHPQRQRSSWPCAMSGRIPDEALQALADELAAKSRRTAAIERPDVPRGLPLGRLRPDALCRHARTCHHRRRVHQLWLAAFLPHLLVHQPMTG